jgi:hypothetical protein
MSLMKFEKKWAREALVGIFPERESGVRVAFDRVNVEGSLDETMELVPWRSGMGLRISIWMVALSPLWMFLHFATIASLGLQERAIVLKKLIYHRNYFVRQLTLLFKAFGALWVFRDPALRAQVLRREPLISLSKKEVRHVAA